ncbi:MAG: hypothetical protein QW544_00750 [Candidatus Caldarchaeum sp.]
MDVVSTGDGLKHVDAKQFVGLGDVTSQKSGDDFNDREFAENVWINFYISGLMLNLHAADRCRLLE